MKNEFDNIQYSPILNHRYEEWFQEVQYNGTELNAAAKRKFIQIADETIVDYSSGLPLLKEILDSIRELHDEFNDAQRIVISVLRFTIITMIDSMVISKYFILADKDYDRRFMRGKMKVILNEGFKKLYGFDAKSHKKSEWNKLVPILKHFPENIKNQYNQLSSLLEGHAKSSSWWRDERNVETHLDIEKLYISRCEDVVESKVMLDSLKLFRTLYAVNLFLSNMHTCLYNYLVDKYHRGELKE
jgi:hypothetical protein